MPYTDEKIGLRAGVDVNGVPVGFQWDVLRRFTDDEGAALGETRVQVAVSNEELATHISAALVAQAADIAADRLERDAIAAERDALATQLATVTAERDALLAVQQAPEEQSA